MATIVTLRALLPKFINRQSRHGPFIFTLTDFHESNFVVDEKYHITGVMDLEWSCVLPRELQHPLFWLNGDDFDDLYGEGARAREEKFESAYEEFLQIFEADEDVDDGVAFSPCPGDYARAIRESISKKTHWFLAAVKTPIVAYSPFVDVIQPQFAPEHARGQGAITFQEVVPKYGVSILHNSSNRNAASGTNISVSYVPITTLEQSDRFVHHYSLDCCSRADSCSLFARSA
jgi:hypothetical protein